MSSDGALLVVKKPAMLPWRPAPAPPGPPGCLPAPAPAPAFFGFFDGAAARARVGGSFRIFIAGSGSGRLRNACRLPADGSMPVSS